MAQIRESQMVIDIRFKSGPPVQLQNLRRVSVYPHNAKDNNTGLPPTPVLITYSCDDRVSPIYWDINDIEEYWITND